MNIFRIVKKEIDKVFKFPRTIFTTLLLPGFLIFVIYSFMGQSVSKQDNENVDHQSIVYVVNKPVSFENAYTQLNNESNLNINFIETTETEVENLKESLRNNQIDLIVVFPINFDQEITNHSTPNFKIYFNNSNFSGIAYNKIVSIAAKEKDSLLKQMNINPNIFTFGDEKVIKEGESQTNQVLSALLPFLIITFIFASAMSLGSDAVAGEKERGTLSTVLMTPIKRNEFIIGKIISTSFLTVIAATSSFIGIIASLPFSKSMFAIEGQLSYHLIDYLGIFSLLILLAFFASSLLLITSTLAKTVKEATMMAMPIYMGAIILPAITMFSNSSNNSFSLYFIPVFNCIIGFKELISLNMEPLHYLIIVSSTIVYITLIISLLIKMFKNERILYSK